MTQVFSNNVGSSITASITLSDTLINLQIGDGALFNPLANLGDYQLATLHDSDYANWEVVSVVGVSGDVLTVARGTEGIQREWLVDTYITANVTAKTLADIVSASEANNILATQANNTAIEASINASSALALAAGNNYGVYERKGDTGDTDYFNLQYWVSTIGVDLLTDPDLDYYTEQYAMPCLGWSYSSFRKAIIFRNGVPQKMYAKELYPGPINDDAKYGDGVVQFMGHMFVRFWPPLVRGEFIEILAPRVPWYVEGELNTWSDMYKVTGVTYSYIAGGVVNSTGLSNDVHYRLAWETHTIRTGTYIPNTGAEGSGAVSDGTSIMWFYGGGSSAHYYYKFVFAPETAAIQSSTYNNYTWGYAITDKLSTWLLAYGATTADVAISKHNQAADTFSVIAGTLVGTDTSRPAAFVAGSYGYIFNAYDAAGSNSFSQFQKLVISTDALSIAAPLAYPTYGSYAAYFRSGKAYLWSTYGIVTFSTATDVFTATKPEYAGGPIFLSMHDCVCDGEHYVLASNAALLSEATDVTAVVKTRLIKDYLGYVELVKTPVGSATDFWSNC